MNEPTNLELPENYFGALDIGSNSFHFVFARLVDGNLQTVHSEKYQVKLAEGLSEDSVLSQAAMERGLQALRDLSPAISKLSAENFRAVATYTLRQAVNAREFLNAAKVILPFDIEVISGHEEARLIYQGVAHYTTPDTTRLVIDIGGGSTECVIGENDATKTLTSLNVGCVSFQRQFFSDGKITEKAFKQAIIAARQELEAHVKRFKKVGWQECLGTSGTIKSIYNLINAECEFPQPINLRQLHELKAKLIACQHVDNITLSPLKESRKTILCSGLAILIAVVEMLEVSSLSYCDYALREGVLYEKFELSQYEDVRKTAISSLTTRFNVEREQADKVFALADKLYQEVKKDWKLTNNNYYVLLQGAVYLHEIGFDINPSSYHKHSEYIVAHADLPGFTLEQQQALAWLVGNHRKKITKASEQQWYLLDQQKLERIGALIRLSVLLSQQRQLAELPNLKISAKDNLLKIKLKQQWLSDKPLIEADLLSEQKHLKQINIDFEFIG
ncbi:exopolyphosphatase [Thalassotalea sp. LPB0316]|uniref:Ppx/GppA phosphatase family protein n=1 Tax=Thalassotalea sp. LPB0316 TaxID=2769490 RepID=UPI0018674482|nr:exopolyphosphatase [Thalassotalea sp. LPB0316]QOL27015.1 exopolyphosphatase [Thalassotalea sp. LPB0316]